MSNQARGSTLDAKVIISALRRLRCRESRQSDAGIFFRTPRGKTLPPIPQSHSREIHMNTIARIKKILSDEGIDFWAGMEGAVGDAKRAATKCSQGIHSDRKVVNGRWICMNCTADLGEYADPKKPLTATLGALSGRSTEELRKLTEKPAEVLARPVSIPQEPKVEMRKPNLFPVQLPNAIGRIAWKIPPEEKLALVRVVRAAWKAAQDGEKYEAVKRVCAENGGTHAKYYEYVRVLLMHDRDINNLSDDDAKFFDTRIDFARASAGAIRGKMTRRKMMAKEGYLDRPMLAAALLTSKTTIMRMEKEGLLPRVDSRFGPLFLSDKIEEYRAIFKERQSKPAIARQLRHLSKEGSEMDSETRRKLLEKVDALMKSGDVIGLSELLDQHNLKMGDIAKLRKDVDKPRTTEERLDRIEKMMEKLVKELS